MLASPSIYDIGKNEWKVEVKTKGKYKPEERRDHLSFISGDELYIFGGHQGNHKEHLCDFFALNLWTLVWRRVQTSQHELCRL